MAKKQKSFRPKARKPRGFQDRLGSELVAEEQMLARIKEVYAQHGFIPLETPSFEFTDALGKFLPDVDRPNQGVFSLQDDDEQWMSLRYDLTAPLARFVAENYDGLPKPFRRYQVGTVWRNEKPGPGRFRQFTQCDADTVGAPAPFADAEAIMMMADAVVAAGLPAEDVVIRVSSRKVMTALLSSIGIDAAAQDGAQAATVLRAMDKYDRLGADGVRRLLGEGRKDESGDYTEGAKLSGDQADLVLSFMQATTSDNAETLSAMTQVLAKSDAAAEGIGELAAIAGMIDALGYAKRVSIDPSIVRGLDYYTGPVFEAEVTREILSPDGQPVQIGSVGGGGRYDDLVKRFKGVEVPAVGCSVGVSRILSILNLLGQQDNFSQPVVILALEEDQMAHYQRMAQALRQEGIPAEVYLGGSGMRAQMKYADKRGAPVVVIRGEDERLNGQVTIKDLALGEQLSQEIESHEEWKEARPAQVTVAEANWVHSVKEMLP